MDSLNLKIVIPITDSNWYIILTIPTKTDRIVGIVQRTVTWLVAKLNSIMSNFLCNSQEDFIFGSVIPKINSFLGTDSVEKLQIKLIAHNF